MLQNVFEAVQVGERGSVVLSCVLKRVREQPGGIGVRTTDEDKFYM